MAFVTGDVSLVEQINTGTDSDSYSFASQTYLADTLYLLFVTSSTGSYVAPTVTGDGLSFTLITSKTNGGQGIAAYRCVPTIETTSVVTMSYNSIQQTIHGAFIVKVTNADVTVSGANAVLQSVTAQTSGDDPSISLATITTGNLAIAGFGVTSSKDWTKGAAHTAITAEDYRYSFGEFNVSDTEVMDATYIGGSTGVVSIALEISENANGATTRHYISFDKAVQSTDFALGMSFIKNLGPSQEVASFVEAVTQTTSDVNDDVAYDVIFDTGPPVDGDTIDVDYNATVGDINDVTNSIALATGTQDGTVCT